MRVQLNPDHPLLGEYKDLTPGNAYRVLGIEADDWRIVNDEGLPYLYPHDLFLPVDLHEPEDWETEYGDEGERYSYPKELKSPGFFEDYFEGNPRAVATLRQYLAEKWRT
jgi:hypothetical protein